MMHVLREPADYPFVIGIQREGEWVVTRIETGRSLQWQHGELLLVGTPDELMALLDDLRDTIRREAPAPEGGAA